MSRYRITRKDHNPILSFRILKPIILCAVVILQGCDDRKASLSPTATAPRNSVTTNGVALDLDYVKRSVSLGMLTNELVSTLGQPTWVYDWDEHKSVWHYAVHPVVSNEFSGQSATVAVAITVRDQRVTDLGYVTVVTSNDKKDITEQVSASSDDNIEKTAKPELKMFVVSETPVPGGTFVDTKAFPKLGYISATPSFAVRQIQSVRIEEQEFIDQGGQIEWSITIVLLPEDQSALESFTTTNIASTTIIQVGETILSAPTIREPIMAGAFSVTCSNRPSMVVASRLLLRMRAPR
jgi:preprotein translocase subunit SecD